MGIHQKTELIICEAKIDELKGKVDKLIIIVVNFNMPLSAIDKTKRQRNQ